ncbi:phosphotransferase family protein [Arthrobacter flavus]|uniref:Phosphotransferase family protein n=1 Tax=Arthrobacter flavus TaxID=95172 RepID=A0ABW4Q397_9MICC
MTVSPTSTVDMALPGLAPFFDSDQLSELLGRPVRADRLRHKPGTSAVARLREDDGGISWLATYAPPVAVKLEKVFARAVASGLELGHVVLPDHPGHRLVTGPIELDHRLYKPLARFRRAGMERLFTDRVVWVLNYNPQRRVVFEVVRGEERLVCKVGTAVPYADGQLLSQLAASGVPVLETVEPMGLPSSRQLQYFTWFGTGDLSTVEQGNAGAASYAAGVALALLHAQPPAFGTHRWRAPAGSLVDLVEENSLLSPELAGRLERLRAGLEPLLRRPGRAALMHGDFSADQVLVDGSDIRLTDLERCTYGAGASDLGSFAAVEILHGAADGSLAKGSEVLSLPRTAAMLDGYSAGPTGATDSEVLAWTIFHLLSRLSNSFRSCSPTWRHDMANHLELMEDILW